MFRPVSSRALAAAVVAATLSAGALAQSMCTLTCPANMTLASLPGQQVTAPVNYTVPVPNGCSASTATQLAGMPTGSPYYVGTTTNVWGALLMGGGTEASCQFTVTVTATPALPAVPTQVPVGGAAALGVLALLTAAGGARILRRREQ